MKNIEINMSSLTNAQRRMCVELIAHSNIKFEHRDNQYIAQVKVGPQEKTEASSKKPREANKKRISRTVKMGGLAWLEELHPFVEIYIYPKRMQLLALCELVENAYQKFWNENKKKSSQVRSLCFGDWFYRSVICSAKDKLKLEQLLVNLVDSLNHFLFKEPGLKLFYRFLSGEWPTDALFYFLVLRGLLEQVTGEKILDRASSPFGCKLRGNPFERTVSEDEMLNFLDVLEEGGISAGKGSRDQLYSALTKKMFWEQSRRKNYIYFFDLLEHLLQDFLSAEASSCALSLTRAEAEAEEQTVSSEDSLHNHLEPPQQQYTLEVDPVDQQSCLERTLQESKEEAPVEFSNQVRTKLKKMYEGLSSFPSQETCACLEKLLETVTLLDKTLWIRYRGRVEDGELLALERLQEEYRQQTAAAGAVTGRLLRRFFLNEQLRRCIVKDIGA